MLLGYWWRITTMLTIGDPLVPHGTLSEKIRYILLYTCIIKIFKIVKFSYFVISYFENW